MFRTDPSSPVPPFEQLRSQVLDAVRSGALAAGAKLPTVRALAQQLGLAPNTVARAYRELEADGILEGRGRNGTFVSEHGDPIERKAQAAAREFADTARQLGLGKQHAIELVEAALRQEQGATSIPSDSPVR
jgi:DNA-binding transcriptional regulator YhcF (GntR family)